MQAAFDNQFDPAIHPATVTGMVGVLEGLAHAARRQSIGVNAMFNEVLTNGIGTTLGQTGFKNERFPTDTRMLRPSYYLIIGS